jgi:hypothetical protein
MQSQLVIRKGASFLQGRWENLYFNTYT